MSDLSLDSNMRNDLFVILGPSLADPTERRGIVWMATESDRELIEEMNWDGPPEVFLVRLLERISDSPNLRPILNSMLKSAKARLDAAGQERATRLQQRLVIPFPRTNAETLPEDEDLKPAHFRVFISSPADVSDERAVAAQIVERLPYDPLVRGWLTTDVVAWDRPAAVPMLAGVTPQGSIDDSGLTPESCDAVLVILWSRIGTRLKQTADAQYLESGTEFEYRRAITAFNKVGTPMVLVYHRTEPAWVKLGSADLPERQEQWNLVNDFLGNLTKNDAMVSGLNKYASTDEFRGLIESHLRELVRRRYGGIQKLARRNQSNSPPPDLVIANPYPGLRAFDIEDSIVFFGRGEEVDGLVERLASPDGRLVVIVGASGSGKSSLVSAGLIPRLRHDAILGSSGWNIVRTTPDRFGLGDPFVSVGVAIDCEHYRPDQNGRGWRPGELTARVRAAEARTGSSGTLLIVDQFEELFTSIDPTKVAPFVDQLLDLLAGDSARIVLTLRSDFYDQCLGHPGLAAALRRASFPLTAPGLGQLYQMITRPAETAGIEIERGLAERILNDTGVSPGALALMAFTLSELFAGTGGSRILQHEQYDRLGGVKGAVGARAKNVFEALDAEAQAQLSTVFRHLITVNEDGAPTRQRGRPSTWSGDTAAQSRFLQAFVGARLLVSSADTNGIATVEVAHEALFQSWPRLQQWIDDVRDDLKLLREVDRAAIEWVRHDRDRSYLWAEERMAPARAATERLGITTADPEAAERINAFLTPEVDRLVAELETLAISQSRRSIIGERLAELGDTRPGVGVVDGLPDIVWCPVQGGVVRLDGLTENYAVENFYISKYPITCGQYAAFVAAPDGYHKLEWWDSMPRRALPPEPYRKLPNHPMESLNWYEAVAFCRWMSHKLGRELRLPNEYEWQMAANGGDTSRVFPWGNFWDEDRANTVESGLGRTIAVGMYPAGIAPCGALDLAGNVWEWCLNESNNPQSIGVFEAEQRAVRGGCWYHEANYCVTTFRNPAWDYAAPRTQLRGFRVLLVDK